MADKIFCDGLIAKAPHQNAPEYVKAALSIRVADFILFLEKHAKPDGWVNIDVKEAKGGKWYAQLNHFTIEKTEQRQESEIDTSNIPF